MQDSPFALAVRRWRERVAPELVGLPTSSRRRAVGLRREELAGLAGISVDYLTRLEQGRATSPSAHVVEALARSLRLSDAERDLLFRLAGLSAPGPGLVPTRITASVQRLLDRLGGVPLVVYDAAWNLIVANPPYDALMGQTSALTGNDRNGVWRNVVGSGSRTVQTAEEHAEQVALLVADLRMTTLRYPADIRLRRLVAELRAASPRFVELWESAPHPAPPNGRGTRSSSTPPSAGSPSSATPSSSPATTSASWSTQPNPAPRTPSGSSSRSSWAPSHSSSSTRGRATSAAPPTRVHKMLLGHRGSRE